MGKFWGRKISFGGAEKSQEFPKLLYQCQGYKKITNTFKNFKKCVID